MSAAPLDTARAAGVVTLRLNRPAKRNALDMALLEALCEAVESAAADPAVRAIVLRGNGPVFCAGLDMAEAADPARSHRSAELIARALRALYGAPKTTIAAVHGAALAGGAGMMSACDIAIAADGTKLGYPEVQRGMVAGLVMTFLKRQVSERQARALLLLGEIVEAERAAQIGLVTRCVPGDLLDDAVQLAIDQALKGAPGAIAITKRFFAELDARSVAQDLEAALGLHVEVRNGGEAQAGMRAFLEKRQPPWQE